VAELIIKVGTNGPDPAWQDGDILHAWNNRDIEWQYLKNDLCHPWKATLNSDGLIDLGTIYEDLLRHTSRFKYEQISVNTVTRTNLVTLETEDINEVPNANGETLELQKWLNRKMAHTNPVNGGTVFPLFGATGAVVWYHKEGNTSQPVLNALWVDIEAKTSELQADHQDSILEPSVLQHNLVVKTTNFTQAIKATYEAQLSDETDPENALLLKRRTHFVDYWDIGGIQEHTDDIRNPNVAVDLRSTVTKVHSNIINVKP
jgi:hypothetical protein